MGTLGKTWSRLDLDEARRLYDSGLRCRQVGQRLGVGASYISRRLRQARIPMRPSGRPLTTPAPTVDPAEIVRLREQGVTYTAIAAALGLSRDMARDRYLKAAGRRRRRLV